MRAQTIRWVLTMATLVGVALPGTAHAQPLDVIVQWNRILQTTVAGTATPTVFFTRPLSVSILILAALLAPIANTQYGLAVALFLLGLGWNFGYVGGSSLLADALQGAERARVQGVNDSLVFFVAGFGSLSSGPLYASGGFVAVSMGGLILTLVMLALIYWLRRPQAI